MAHRQQIQFGRVPAGFSIRSGTRPDRHASEIASADESESAAQETQRVGQLERIQETLDSLQFAMNDYETRRQQSLSDLQLVAVELAVTAASHVIRAEIAQGAMDVGKLVAGAIDRMSLLEPAVVRLHPSDLAQLDAQLSGEKPLWDSLPISIAADASIERGAVRLEAESGRVVMSDVATRLTQIRDEWLENIDDTQTEYRNVSNDAQSMRRFPDRRETA